VTTTAVGDHRPEPPPGGGDGRPPAVTVRGLAKRSDEVEAVAGIDSRSARARLRLPRSAGAGKSTTTGMLCTLVRPTGGGATVAGHDVALDPGVTWFGRRVPTLVEAGVVALLGLVMLGIAVWEFSRAE
jgi:hypothetical protein